MNPPAKPTSTAAAKPPQRHESVRKWTKTVLKAGHTTIPAVLLLYQRELRLNPVDLNILLQLACHWWKANNKPYPSKATLAKRMDVDRSTVRRHIAKMEKRGLITRVNRMNETSGGQASNYYDLRPLVNALHKYAIKALKEKAARKRNRAARGSEDKP